MTLWYKPIVVSLAFELSNLQMSPFTIRHGITCYSVNVIKRILSQIQTVFIWGLVFSQLDLTTSQYLSVFVNKGVINEILRFTASRLLPWQQATDVTTNGWLSSSCTAFGIPDSSSFRPRRPRAPFPQVYTSPSVENRGGRIQSLFLQIHRANHRMH